MTVKPSNTIETDRGDINPAIVLSQPITLPCGYTMGNRIAKAAMSEQLAQAKTGDPSDALASLYKRWAMGGAGLLITGNVMVSAEGIGEAGNVCYRDRAPLELYRRWADAAQTNGAGCFMQINHAGRQVIRFLNPKPVAPSAVPLRISGMFAEPRALAVEEIHGIIRAFSDTALLAKSSGFSGIQLHAAHGYLISQFLSPLSNRRKDAYGGNLENRMRFLMECYRTVRAACGKGFPISVKLNSADFLRGGFGPEEAAIVAKTISEEGVDLIEISGGTYEKPEMLSDANTGARRSTQEREAHFVDFARQIRGSVLCPLMLTGGLRSPAKMAALINDGSIDIAGIARPLVLEPDFPMEILNGRSKPASTKLSVRWPISLLTSLAAGVDMYYYTEQIKRLSRGLNPTQPGYSIVRLMRILYEARRRGMNLRSACNRGGEV